MATFATAFDANSVAPQQPFDIIPPGKYRVQIVDSDMRPTKDGAGQYLWLELDVLDGEYAGRKLWDRLNIANPNAQAVEIAQRTLSAICHATGQLSVADSEQLHFKPMVATVRVRPEREQFGASNEIRGYAAADGSRPATATVAGAARPAAATKPAAPWKRSA